MPYFVDIDGNFVKDFQSDGFDARAWELYLFAAMTEQGCVFDRTIYAPDYYCDHFGSQFFIEATTVNATKKNGIISEPDFASMGKEEYKNYLLNYMPIKWGSALYSKLQKKYWDLPHVSGKPILFAVQDFHLPQAMSVSGSTLMPYLYGIEFSALYDMDGNLFVNRGIRADHTWGGKTIPSGFFNQPEADNISAVISNPLGTLSKFNRIGLGAGFGSDAIRMLFTGTCHDHDPNASVPIPFRMTVRAGHWDEPWCGGMNIFHNPNAKHPLDPDMFQGVAQHHFTNGKLVSLLPKFHPYGAMNMTIVPDRIG
ncbi:MAG: hypothetical protein JWQ49_4065 [Edaphobacter sp.]|nr:hypothetical protein [Edaphobacter sp.]